MSYTVIDFYEEYTTAPDERARARILAHTFEELAARYPQLQEITTRQDLSETELKLIKEIEQVRAEIKETELKLTKEIETVRLDLTKEIEQVRAEIKETELKLTKEIETVRYELTKEIETVRYELTKEIETVRLDLTKEIEMVRLEIAQLKAEVGRDIERARSSMLLWSFGFWITQLGVLLTLLWRIWPLFEK